jgi:hypothetical protein
MAYREEALEPISWSSADPEPGVDADLERDLRSVCERGDRVTPDLAQDALFWLDVGGEPRDVAQWLRHEIGDGRHGARFPKGRDGNSLFSRDQRTPDAGQKDWPAAEAIPPDASSAAQPSPSRVTPFWTIAISFMVVAMRFTQRRRSGRPLTRKLGRQHSRT